MQILNENFNGPFHRVSAHIEPRMITIFIYTRESARHRLKLTKAVLKYVDNPDQYSEKQAEAYSEAGAFIGVPLVKDTGEMQKAVLNQIHAKFNLN